jgi:hypothetical protein
MDRAGSNRRIATCAVAADINGDGCVDEADAQQWLDLLHAQVGPDVNPPPAGTRDTNLNDTFDLADWPPLADCLSGPNVPPGPSQYAIDAAGCAYLFDTVQDGDVDLIDFARLQDSFVSR